MEELRIWTDGTEAYVAATVDAAMAMQRELLGENPADSSEWFEDTRAEFVIVDESMPAGEERVKKTREQWIRENGPGFLFSSEY